MNSSYLSGLLTLKFSIPKAFQFQIRDRIGITHAAEDLARVMVSAETGKITYANEAFRALAGMDAPSIQITDEFAANIIQLADYGDLDSLASGAHSILVGKDPITLDFHFDWIDAPNGQRYLVASEIDVIQPEAHDESLKFFEQRLYGSARHGVDRPIAGNDSVQAALGSLEENTDLRHFLNMSNEVMIVTDDHGDLIRVNTAFHRQLKFKEDDILNLNFLDLFDESERPSVRNYLQTLTVHDSSNTDIVDFEAQAQSKSGKNLWMEWRLQHSFGQIYCVGRDLSSIKRHEHQILEREKELSEAEIIGRMGRWRWVVGRDAIDWSDQIYRIFGVTRDEFSPSIDSLNEIVHRRDVGRVVQGFQRAIIEQNDYDMEFRVVRPGGDIRYIHCEGRCERDKEGDVIALYGIMQDMTERMLYERELKEAKDAAERAYAAKSQFLANMSHELRTPLNAIIGFSEMMQRQLLGPIGTEKYLDYIAGIRESGEHLLDLISDILDMSKIEAGKHDLDLEELNVTKTIKLAVHMMEGRAHECGIRIMSDALTNDDLVITADRRAFMQIILNLLSNAVKFSHEGGRVWIECMERPEFISIKIRDEGIGIPANKLHCILKPFEQASPSYTRNHEGSGLGLAITKELAELHGGAILVESAINEGTTVTVRIPYKQNQS